MKIFDALYDRLKRKTNATNFIPQIDGLRFLAIMLVVFYHINGFVVNKVPFTFPKAPSSYPLIYNAVSENGVKGVLLFFTISGFILGLPFAKHYWQQGKEVKLKDYFLRRLTRLEPPYIINMVASAFLLIWFGKGAFSTMFPDLSFTGILPSLAASLAYMHNILYPKVLSINPVAWSLEIEVQFYCLVPVLVLVFKLSKVRRRITLAGLIVLFVALQHFLPLQIRTLYSFIQYFLLGFLLVDVYLSGIKFKLAPLTNAFVGIVLLVSIVYLGVYRNMFTEYLFIMLVLVFYTLVLSEGIWNKIFSFRFITAIGGMCYSIYLWHDVVMSGVGNRTIFFNPFHSYPLSLLWHTSILLMFILGFSTVYYLLVERPCMDKDWPIKLWNFSKSIFMKKKIIPSPVISK